MFFAGSRYLTAGPVHTITLADGTQVNVARVPLPAPSAILGWRRVADEDRLDLLADEYVGDATAGWVLGWTNGAMVLDALAAHDLIAVPRPR